MGTSRRAPGRCRGASLLQFEALEGRCTPTALPAGFTEAAVATGLSSPTAMEFAPDGRLFVLKQAGNVEFVRGDGTTWTALHLNVDSQGERGLLGIAFDPAFASNHFVYLYYTNPGAGGAAWATGEHNQLSRFTVDDSNPTRPIFKDEAPILDWDNLSAATNHNGGAIHFGLDGMLYADAGDNAQTFTQGGNTYRVSQTLSDLLGKQLRIDVGAFNRGVATRDDTAVGHLIPADNPFVGMAPGINQLIYALGLRNPYTFAVQPGTGTIYINDVGETTWEEIDRSVPGANFGWSGGNTDGFGHPSPPGPGVYQDPLLAYNHSGGPAGGGIAIVGGTFYNPARAAIPGLLRRQILLRRPRRRLDPGVRSGQTGQHHQPRYVVRLRLRYPRRSDRPEGGPGREPVLPHGRRRGREGLVPGAGIATQPVGLTVNEGQSATFTVVASGPSLSYQWQHLIGASWVDVGVNSRSYTIAAATTADASGYRVIVSNPVGFAVSDAVVLAVNPAPGATLAPGLVAEFFDFSTRLRSMPNLAGRVADVTRIDAAINYFATRLPLGGPRCQVRRQLRGAGDRFLGGNHLRPLPARSPLEGRREALARWQTDRQ